MAYDDTTRSATTPEVPALTLLADADAVLPDVDHCTVRTTSDVAGALARPDTPDVVVLGSSSPAVVTDAIRRLRAGRTRTLLVCQGALPAPVTGTVTTVDGSEDPTRAVERAAYLALVDRQHALAVRRSDPSDVSSVEDGRLARVETMRATYADRFDADDFGVLYGRL